MGVEEVRAVLNLTGSVWITVSGASWFHSGTVLMKKELAKASVLEWVC